MEFIGWGADSTRREYESRQADKAIAERKVIEEVAKATGTLPVTVRGEVKYVPLAKARELGLV